MKGRIVDQGNYIILQQCEHGVGDQAIKYCLPKCCLKNTVIHCDFKQT